MQVQDLSYQTGVMGLCLCSNVSQSVVRHALIATVGQTAEPIITAITFHSPEGVLLIASQGSQQIASQVRQEFVGEVKTYTFLLDDAESLQESLRCGQACA